MITLDQIRERCIEVGNCWEWQGGTSNGLPKIYVPGKDGKRGGHTPARRYVMKLMGTKLEQGQLVSPKCGNSLCIAPHHAVISNRSEVALRMHANGFSKTAAFRAKIGAIGRARSKLTPEIVQEMRLSGLTTRAAGKKYGISQYSAWRIMSGNAWKDYSSPFAGLVRQN